MPKLPTDAQERKETPIYAGFMKYFPMAMAEVARLSLAANEQHNPGTEMHWDRSKSGDELEALARHLVEAGTIDDDGQRHSAKVAWRAMANLEKELEGETVHKITREEILAPVVNRIAKNHEIAAGGISGYVTKRDECCGGLGPRGVGICGDCPNHE